MIRFTLRCANSHSFESWFQSGEAFESLKAAGHVACPHCGSISVEKAIMAPSVSAKEDSVPPPKLPAVKDTPAKAPPAEAIAKLRDHIEQNSEHVGKEFASEARAIRDGASPERSIYGEAKPEDARKLLEDGVPVAPLPFVPKRKMS